MPLLILLFGGSMLYRIDYKHFLLHMIDHFTYDELMHMQFLIISTRLSNAGRATNVAKCSELYPNMDTCNDWYANQNMDTFRRGYLDYLNSDNPVMPTRKEEVSWLERVLFVNILKPINANHDVVLVCHESENFILDVLCEFIKEKTELETINLNQLFSKGELDPFHFNRDKIWDRAVDITRAAMRDGREALKSTADGRAKLLESMTQKEKIKELKKAGVHIRESEKDSVDEMLLSIWTDD